MAITEIVAWRDRQFDPDIVDAICRLHRRGTLAELAQVVAKVAGVPLGNGPVGEGTVGERTVGESPVGEGPLGGGTADAPESGPGPLRANAR
jgi:hypothetical protein